MDDRSAVTEILRTETEPVMAVMAEACFLMIESAGLMTVEGISTTLPLTVEGTSTTVPSTGSRVENVEAVSRDTGAAMAWDPRVRAAMAMARNCILDEILYLKRGIRKIN
jgi:hypothetical protein